MRAKINKFLLIKGFILSNKCSPIDTKFHFGVQLKQKKRTKNFVNEKTGKSRCSDGEKMLKCDYFIARNSNPAVVPLAAVIQS